MTEDDLDDYDFEKFHFEYIPITHFRKPIDSDFQKAGLPNEKVDEDAYNADYYARFNEFKEN
eukprot:CAMPEP_0170545392 /NCGR_PEP_ID=MMETSP0211-20121228/3798_1 /TAXON_ID=311385 /ORGANISM="Pseudokeronopsis sp., Strain OXSARD2" /LENGTH=61 /DNA_ID=CAMNT_0010849283 /DNA_START=84 /DNA_END=269 /DNA_ORIENTATION=+